MDIMQPDNNINHQLEDEKTEDSATREELEDAAT